MVFYVNLPPMFSPENPLTSLCRPIEAELECFQTVMNAAFSHSNPLLKRAVCHLSQAQGKRMRPILVLLAAKYVGGVNDAVIDGAVALELLHTASLVHDDVVDESAFRRGQASVNSLMGNKLAVLVGDFLVSRALSYALRTDDARVIEWVAMLGEALADGELMQLSQSEAAEMSEEAYYDIVEKKTASLFSMCARVGAHLAGGSPEDVKTMSAFGHRVGLCFQLRDDIFDYDDSNLTGKPTGKDMREGQLTLPVLHALSAKGTPELRTLAGKVRRGEASDSEISRLVAFTKEAGGIEYAEQAMRSVCQQAVSLLSPRCDEAVLSSLRQYAAFVAQRSM